MLFLSRLVGLAASVGVIGLWSVFSFFNPYNGQQITGATYLIAGLMINLAGLGVVAVLSDKPYLMMLVFVFSFVPVGLYLLGTPGIFRWIGVFNLLFLVSVLLNFRLPRNKDDVH